MSEQQREAAEAMYRALQNLGCRCEHNVLYAGLPEPQYVTKQCARCRSMADWEKARAAP